MGLMRRASALVLVFLIGCGGKAAAPTPGNRSTTPAPPEDSAVPGDLPADVEALIERWEMCHHWAGEDPYDAERAAQIQAGVAESCPGNEDTRAALEARYADRPAILARLRSLPE
jgi:hypothetical protein